MLVLKPHDLLVVLKVAASRRLGPAVRRRSTSIGPALSSVLSPTLLTEPIASESWTYAALAASVLMDVAAVHDSLKAAAAARLYDPSLRLPIKANLLEFLVHGVKYCYPMRRGELTRGLVTSYAASPLVSHFPPLPGEPPVWPYSLGVATGAAIEPLHPRAPEAALSDPALAELLVLIDGVREPIARVNAIAADELAKRLGP